METKILALIARPRPAVLLGLVVFFSAFCHAEPFRLTPEGATGNTNDGLGMSAEELRKQLGEYWLAGDVHKFYAGGHMLCEGLKRKMATESAAQNYIDTCIDVLSHEKTTSKDLYGLDYLVGRKGRIGTFMLGGDYLRFFPAAKYQQARMAVVGAGTKLMDELREELKRKAPVLPELTANPDKLEGEERAKAIEELHEQQHLRLATSSAIICYKQLPDVLREMETKFVAFVEQEYRRVPSEKGEMEDIIARAGLPKEASERLRLLIPC